MASGLNQFNRAIGKLYGANSYTSTVNSKTPATLKTGDWVQFTDPATPQDVQVQSTGIPYGVVAYNAVINSYSGNSEAFVEICWAGLVDVFSAIALNKGDKVYVLGNAIVAAATSGAFFVGYAHETISAGNVGTIRIVQTNNVANP